MITMTIFETSTAFSDNKETHSHTHSIHKDGEPLEWQPIHSEEELHLAAQNGGSYYLAVDIDLTKELKISKDMNLCLNDKVLKQTAKATRVIFVNARVYFNLCDCRGEKGTIRYWDKNAETGLWTLRTDDNISAYMTVGGVITGGSTSFGGGVINLGTFNMYGGNITGNRVLIFSGGVLNEGTFIMHGGSITGNRAKYGGGVWNSNRSFTMRGGRITGNKAQEYGGGVYNGNFATFFMNGGEITGNKATNGGGVYNNCIFIMNDGEIAENSAVSFGGGVSTNKYTTFTMHGGNITGNTAKSDNDIYTHTNERRN